ncbi:MAG: AmmeMemoRadiSam system radical SAM enzyme [Endomicrobiales bacterium]|nr:AmmeMemoRadiSam system radical SAM enzyme [Endomicrobiales bacterium]
MASIAAITGSEEARYYTTLPTGEVACQLCPRACVLREGQTGNCRVRKNVKGKLQSLVYARPCSVNIDPIEKKPLFHFLPASDTFSIATVGCNLRCVFCQNWTISQAEPDSVDTKELPPEDIVFLARQKKCASISYTYSEPTVFYEYMYDCAFLAREHGIKNVWVTCGVINKKPLEDLCGVLDAANVDLKGFTDATYMKMAAAKLSYVLGTLKTLKERGVWLEIGYLVIPEVNDSDSEIGEMVKWVRENLGDDVPVHFLRFFPMHKLTNLPPTPVASLEKAYNIAKNAGINYVYVGNVPGHPGNNTYCPKCKKLIIERKGYFLAQFHVKNGKCEFCGKKIAGVWK